MVFDFEKMEVYHISLEVIDTSVLIINKLPRGSSHLADQLKRAAASISLNISEGVGEFKPQEKARCYRMALRSASESCSIAQIGYRLKLINAHDYEQIYLLLTSVSKMLTKLVAAMQTRT